MQKVTVRDVDIPGVKPERFADVMLYFPIELRVSVSRSTPNWMNAKEELLKLHEGDRISITFPSGKRSVGIMPAISPEGKRVGEVDLLYFFDDEHWECDDPVVFNDYGVDMDLFVFRALCRLQNHISVRLISECDQQSHYPSCRAVIGLKGIKNDSLPPEIVSVEDSVDVDGRYAELKEKFDKYEMLYPDGVSDLSRTAAQNAPPKTRKSPSHRYEELAGSNDISVGYRFRFGSEKRPWVVLKVLDDRMLVISDDCVCVRERNKGDNCSWEVAGLRRFLNDSYYNEKFSDTQKEMILLTHNTNQGNTKKTVSAGNDTDDYIFVLSADEINELMPDKQSRERTQFWWVRTPGANRNQFCFVGAKGTIFSNGWVGGPRGVRPCMWLKLP